MAPILPGRRTRQSQQTPRIDWSNPITRGLVAVFDMTGPAPVELLTRYGTSASLYSRASSTWGVGQRKNAATSDGLKTFLGANANSAIVISSPANSATIKPFFSQRPNAGGVQYSFGANWNTGFTAAAGSLTLATNGNVNLTNTAAITGALAMYGYSLTSSTAGQLYVNGAPIATTVSGTGFPAIVNPEFNILSHSGSIAFNDTTTPLIVLWNRALTDAEHRSLAANPWQIFAAQPRQFYAETVAGTTVSCTVGAETEAGLTAAIALSTAFTTSIYTENEAGLTAAIALSTAFTCTVGAETEAGPSAAIALSTAFTTTTGAEVEAGLTATISGDLNIVLSVANENEAGIIATVAVSTQINCVIGNEAEAGLSATIANGTTIVCAVSNEQEVGLGATITASGGSSTGLTPWYHLAHKRGKR